MGSGITQDESTLVYPLDVEVSYLNDQQIMKPSAYQALFAQLAERHLITLGADSNVTMQHGLSWALISLSLEVRNPIHSCMRLNATTWYSQRKGPYFRRELVFAKEDGTVMFQGSTFSVLLDLESRTIHRKKEVPFPLNPPKETFCIDAEPRYRGGVAGSLLEARTARNSQIDSLGHVNNRHYGDFAFDALTEEELLAMSHLSRMDFYFISELRNQDSFQVYKAVEENRFVIQGNHMGRNELAFVVEFHL